VTKEKKLTLRHDGVTITLGMSVWVDELVNDISMIKYELKRKNPPRPPCSYTMWQKFKARFFWLPEFRLKLIYVKALIFFDKKRREVKE